MTLSLTRVTPRPVPAPAPSGSAPSTTAPSTTAPSTTAPSVSARHAVAPGRPLVDGVVPYPPAAVEAYRSAGYWIGQTHDDLLRAAVADAPDRIAVVGGHPQAPQRWTYAELDERVERLAAGLHEAGLRPGERVVVQLPNEPDFVRVVFALWRVGAVPVFALPAHRRAEIEYFARFTDAAGYITCGRHDGFDHRDLARTLRDEVPSLRLVVSTGPDPERQPADRAWLPSPTSLECDAAAPVDASAPGDVAFLQLSGGTTGTPKLIPRTHDDYLYSVRESARIAGLHAGSVLLLALPAAHNFSMSSPGLLGAIHARATTVLTTDPSPASVYRLIAQHRVTIAPAVPPLALAWLNSPDRPAADLSSLEVLQVGGARLCDSVAARVRPELGCELQQVFGMAEGLVNYTRLGDPDDVVTATQGRPISPADEIRVVDDHDRPIGPGVPGHLLTRGPYTIRGYYRAPEHNARAFTADGFYRTGDLVIARPDGYLSVVGRAKDQINRGGEKVAPQEIEDHLLTHPDVHDASVVGVPDDHLGERVLAHVVLRAGAGRVRPVDLRRHLQARGVAGYKIPDEFALGDTLPQTGVGKIDRRHLRDGGGQETYDIVGVGFGPANLALAIAVEEHNESAAPGERLRLLCCEKRGGSQWHPGMLLPDASMQVSFLKDLVTFRNPCSPYTFVNFLRSVDRLVDFTNRATTAPLRIEFAAYLRWVAERLDHHASLATEVMAITPLRAGVDGDGPVTGYDVTVRRKGAVSTLRARHVVVAAGLQPRLPRWAVGGGQAESPTTVCDARIWHSGDYLPRIGRLADARDLVVVGSGQSAIEVVLDAYERVPGARIHLVSSQFGIGPSDHGPLVNEIFDPASVDALYAAPPAVRDRLDALHRGANHGTAHPREITALHDLLYRDRWLGSDRLRVHRVSRVTGVSHGGEGLDDGTGDGPAGVIVHVTDDLTGATTQVRADAVVCATGYRPFDTGALLGQHADLLVRDDQGRPLVERDCRARLRDGAGVAGGGGLYLLGQSDHQHGFATSLLSTAAVRAGDVLASVLAARSAACAPVQTASAPGSPA